MSFKDYYQLTKPGIIYGNAVVAAAGFFYASRGDVNWLLLAAMLLGLSLVIGSACVFNNYYDREIDAKMTRTKTRALVSGSIPPHRALYFGAALGILGVAILFFFTTALALYAALAGWLVYVCLYTPLKHRSAHALWVGAVAGATPPVVGYAAVTNMYDSNALWLFLFLLVWQVPHFLGIAAYRYEEYFNAGVPLYIAKNPSARQKRIGRSVFYLSLAALLLWCGALTFHR